MNLTTPKSDPTCRSRSSSVSSDRSLSRTAFAGVRDGCAFATWARAGLAIAGLAFVLAVPSPALAGDPPGLAGTPIWIADTDLYVRHVEAADLNGDGVADAIGGEYDANSFGAPSKVTAVDGTDGSVLWVYGLLDGVRSMALADLSNDGVADVIAGASESSSTPDGRIHAIDGVTGTALWTYATGATTSDVTSGNLNGDAFPDVVAASFDDSIYAIDGATGALLWNTVIDSLWINAVSTGDVTGDGIDDVAYAHEYLTGFTNRFGVLDGTDGSIVWEMTGPDVVLEALMADVDGDGALEAVFGTASDADTARLDVRDGATGALEWSFALGSMDSTNGEIRCYVADVDGDSDLDLAVATTAGSRRVFLFEGDAPATLWLSATLPGTPRDLAFGDVTGDGSPDVAVATGDRVQVLRGTTGEEVWYYAVAGTLYGVATADLDGDSTLDVLASGGAESVGTPPDPAKSIFALRTGETLLHWELEFGEYGNAVALADLDGDDAEEVIVVNSLADSAIAIGGADGSVLWTWTGTENLYAVATGDFTIDGEPDVVVAGNDDTVTALGGNTGSVLWQSFLPGDQIYRKCLATAALGGDAADDVVVGSDDGIVRALDGSDGSLLWSVNLGGDIEEVEVADMNGSGPDDVVAVAGWPGNRLAVIDGSDGSILWEYDQDMDYARHVEVLDTNGDGIPDVAVGVPVVGAGDGRVFVLDGISHAEVWSAPMTFNSDYGLAHGDLDGDGRDDVVAAGNSTDRTVHALDGDDGLPLWMHPTGGDVNVVRVVDLDRDGRSEVVAGSDDQIVRVLDGCSGEEILSLTTAGDVMDVAAGDISGDGLPNLAAVTFDSDGVAYVLRPLEERVVIVDQSDAEFVIVDGSWPERSYRKAIDGSLAFRRPGTGGNRAAWRVDNSGGAPFLTPGTYDVFTWKFEHPRLHRMATNAPFRVYHAGGNSPWIRVDQSAPNDSWLYLGTFAFDNDSPQGVLVSDDADGVVAADAVRFIRR